MTHLSRPLLTLALALALTACSNGQDDDSMAKNRGAVVRTPPAASTSGPYLVPEEVTADDEAPAGDDSLINAAADPEAEEQAAEAALATAQVWVQGDTLDQQEWNSQLLDTIAPIAHSAYDDRTWGYQVEASAITGRAATSEATMTTATVTVPTDAGPLVMTVTRPDEQSPWLTTAIQPTNDATATP